jgi:drug/metabolite transporter (DMT)-like permease
MTNARKFEGLLLLTTMIWGFGFSITQIAVDTGFRPFTIMSGRFLIGTIVLAIIFRRRISYMNRQTLIWGLLTGVLLFAGFAFQTFGIVYTTPAKNAMITQMMVIMIPFILWIFYKRRPTGKAFIGAIIALLGGVILTINVNQLTAINVGDALSFACAVMVALHVVLSAEIAKRPNVDPVVYTLIQFSFAAGASVLLAPTEPLPIISSGIQWWPLIFLGVLNTAWGFTIQTYAHKYSNASRTSIIVTSEALFAAVFSVLLGQDIFGIQLLIGGGVLLCAIYYVVISGEGVIDEAIGSFT